MSTDHGQIKSTHSRMNLICSKRSPFPLSASSRTLIIYWCSPHLGWFFTHQFWAPHASHLWKHPPRHSQKCLPNFPGDSQSSLVETKVTHHRAAPWNFSRSEMHWVAQNFTTWLSKMWSRPLPLRLVTCVWSLRPAWLEAEKQLLQLPSDVHPHAMDTYRWK